MVAFAAGNQARHSVGVPGPVLFPSNVQINGVLTVGATDRNDQQADYSPTSNAASPDNQIIDIVAPSHRAYPPEAYPPGVVGGIPGEGFEVWTIDIPGNDGYNQWNNPFFPIVAPAFGEVLPTTGTNNLSYTGRMGGTSAACPQVAAVAALILSVNNNLTQQQVFDIITQSAEDVGGYNYNANGWCPELGNGRLNACAALTMVSNNYSISGNDQVCSSATYTIQGLPTPANIQWISSNPAVATVSQTGVVTLVSTGTITLTANITVPNRCGVAVVTKSLEIVSYTTSDYTMTGGSSSQQPLYWCPNQTYSFYVNGPGSNYSWTIPTGWTTNYISDNICVIKAPASTSPPTGTVYVSFTEPCGNIISKSFFTAYSSSACTGTDPRFTFSPNPAPSYLYVTVASGYVGTVTIKRIQIIRTTTGVTVFDQSYGSGVTSAYITTSSFATGTYSLRIFDGSVWATYQFVR